MAPESVVKSISEQVGQSGRSFVKVELADGTKAAVLDKKRLEGIAAGARVYYETERNAKGFVNFTELRPLPDEPAGGKPAETGGPTDRVEVRESLSTKDRATLSMNALNCATGVFIAMVNAGLLKPVTSNDAIKLMDVFYGEMMRLHGHPVGADEPAKK